MNTDCDTRGTRELIYPAWGGNGPLSLQRRASRRRAGGAHHPETGAEGDRGGAGQEGGKSAGRLSCVSDDAVSGRERSV